MSYPVVTLAPITAPLWWFWPRWGLPTYGGTVGSFFQVDLDALGHFVTSLQESGDHMESALDASASPFARVAVMRPNTLVSNWSRTSRSDCSSNGPPTAMPALFTSP